MLISPPSTIPYVDLKSQWQSEREELLPIIEKYLLLEIILAVGLSMILRPQSQNFVEQNFVWL